MATQAQTDLFNRLLGERDFPVGTNKDQLRADFPNIPDKSASAWIDKALKLPEAGEVPPPF